MFILGGPEVGGTGPLPEVASFSFYLGGAIRTLDRIEKRAAGV